MSYQLPDDPDAILALHPEELGLLVLRRLVVEEASQHPRSSTTSRSTHTPHNLFNRNTLENRYPREHAAELEFRFAEAWGWLVSQGLIVRSLETQYPKYAMSRLGQAVAQSPEAEREFLASTRLSKESLHPAVQARSWQDYIRGDFSGAVFKAFQELEIAVRDATELPLELIGVPLMDEAFKPHTGKLTSKQDPEAEQVALRRLFSGAIGSYKNPHSHRHVVLAAREAGEMLVLASHLLSIVDARRV